MAAGSRSIRMVRGQTWLDRWLCVFTEVRTGEAAGALLLAANVFCLTVNTRNWSPSTSPRVPRRNGGSASRELSGRKRGRPTV